MARNMHVQYARENVTSHRSPTEPHTPDRQARAVQRSGMDQQRGADRKISLNTVAKRTTDRQLDFMGSI